VNEPASAARLLSSVAEFIDLRATLEGLGPLEPPSQYWAYRGQPKAFGSLTPSFQRQFSKQWFGAAEIIERDLINAFRGHYAKLGDLSRDMPQPTQIGEGHDLRCLSVMQHYEIPTRLLDWTGNFWTAVYFACSNDPGENGELWFYARELFTQQRFRDSHLNSLVDRSANASPEPRFLGVAGNKIVELDPQISPRMRQQFAHHTVSGLVFSDHARLLRELDAESPPASEAIRRVDRVVIDASCKGKMLQFLDRTVAVNAGTIFPDVVGLGRFLRWQFDSLRTMML
jgi:hypothetical protein